jgi:hypothetical protein
MARGSQGNNPEARHRLDRDDVDVWDDLVRESVAHRHFRLRNFFPIVFILLYRSSGCQATAAAMATPIATDGDTLNAHRGKCVGDKIMDFCIIILRIQQFCVSCQFCSFNQRTITKKIT